MLKYCKWMLNGIAGHSRGLLAPVIGWFARWYADPPRPSRPAGPVVAETGTYGVFRTPEIAALFLGGADFARVVRAERREISRRILTGVLHRAIVSGGGANVALVPLYRAFADLERTCGNPARARAFEFQARACARALPGPLAPLADATAFTPAGSGRQASGGHRL